LTFIKGSPRSDFLLFPEALDDYVSDDNPVRFIEAFVDNLDLQQLGFSRTTPAHTGRPAYSPADLLKLYIYGYINRLGSSRLLERDCSRNLELLWLMRTLRPDFKTISDFRKDNAEPIKRVCREFTLMCKRLDLFGSEFVAIDGSKFKAQNSRRRNFTREKLDKSIKEIDAKIQGYLEELDEADEQEAEVRPTTAEQLKEKIKQLRNRSEPQISLTDTDSRSMKVGQGSDVFYNLQIAVDSKHKLIVEHEVTNEPTDHGQLSNMALRAKQRLGVSELEVVADKGYYDGAEVKKCEQAGITVYYDPQKDCYECPAGKQLRYRGESFELGRHIRYYSTNDVEPVRSNRSAPVTRG